MDIKELAELAAMPVRNVRYLIAQKFVDGPDTSAGPVNAVYTERHLEQLRLYQSLRDAGLSQQAIRAMTEEREPSEVAQRMQEVARHVAPGIEMRIVPALVPGDLDREELVHRILGILSDLGVSKKGNANVDAQDEDRRSAGEDEAQGRRPRQRRR